MPTLTSFPQKSNTHKSAKKMGLSQRNVQLLNEYFDDKQAQKSTKNKQPKQPYEHSRPHQKTSANTARNSSITGSKRISKQKNIKSSKCVSKDVGNNTPRAAKLPKKNGRNTVRRFPDVTEILDNQKKLLTIKKLIEQNYDKAIQSPQNNKKIDNVEPNSPLHYRPSNMVINAIYTNSNLFDTSNYSKLRTSLLKHGNSLDKLAQLPPTYSPADFSASKKALYNKAKHKYSTNGLCLQLKIANPKSPLLKGYLNTYYCQNAFQQKDDTLETSYCKNRWCITCNKIRTANLINGYAPQLEKLDNPYFITLTRPNVKRQHLHEEIDYYIKTFQNIKKAFKKELDKPFIGIRKFECTYNPISFTYHPHFHIVLAGGSERANQLIVKWLEANPTATRKGQDARPLANSIELFKYFTKLCYKVNTTNRKFNTTKTTTKTKVYPQALDHIFQCIKGRRIYQPFGVSKIDEEDFIIERRKYPHLLDGTTSNTQTELTPHLQNWTYLPYYNDWINTSTGETLTNYEPEKRIQKIFNPNNYVLIWDTPTLFNSTENRDTKAPKIFKKTKKADYYKHSSAPPN